MAGDLKETKLHSPSWLDKDFIQMALRAGDEDSSITVLSCDIHLADAVGDGYASDMYRVTATLRDSQQRSVIVKCHPQGGKREEAIREWQAFEKETHMLTKVLPAMHEMLQKARPGQYKPLAAKCLHAGEDPIPFIVLEDLKQTGFTLAERQQGMDLAHCSLAIKTLAHFHAASLALYEQDPTTITYYTESLYSENLRHQWAPLTDRAINLLRQEVLKWAGYEKYAEKFQMIRESYLDRLIRVCERKKGAYNCLIHGDFKTNNMMIKYCNGSVADLRLVDFQTVHYSSPTLDLQYFFNSSPSEEVRIQHMDYLIEEYYTTLIETLNILGCSKHQFSLEKLRKDFEENTFFGFYSATIILPIILSDPSDDFDYEVALQGKGEETNRSKIFSKENFVTAMKRLLPVFESKGVFESL